MTFTVRVKRRRLWLVGFSPGRLLLGALIVGVPSLFYLDQWRWVPAVLFAYALVASFHVVTFTASQPLTFSYYVGVFRECRAELASLELHAIVGDHDDDVVKPDDHIQVGPGTGIAVFPCRRPAETIAWIEARLTAHGVPAAKVVAARAAPRDGAGQ